jgi:class 3 adenylate cyclase
MGRERGDKSLLRPVRGAAPAPCPACGFENEPATKFCGGCGKPIGEVAAPAPVIVSAAPRADAAERRQLTVMFCDLVGSTALASRLDPEDLRDVIGTYHKCVAETIGRFDGFLAKYMGDGVLVYFGYPRAHEDDAERAVRASLAVVEAVRRVPSPELLQVRIGLATGLAVVGDLIGSGAAQEQAVIGETPNLAARLQALAGPDEIVIPENTRRLVGNLFEYDTLGQVEVKGLSTPVSAYRVVRESRVDSRFEALRTGETPLVGRDEEIELLRRRWAQAKAGRGRVVLISAEPGIGKSRLAEAFRQSLENEPHTRLRYFCSPHHQDSALFPFIAQLERAAGFERDDTPGLRLDKLEALIAANSPAEGDVPLLAELLSLPLDSRYPALDITPQRKKEKTFDALLRGLEDLARQQPVLMVFEDLHWMDPTSRELLDLTVQQIDRMPVLQIATFRPEFQVPWTDHPHITTLSLGRLARG